MDTGFRYFPGYFDAQAQQELLAEVLAGLEAAPLYQPHMPRSGTPMSVIMSNFGPLGWIARQSGYAYEPLHPETQRPWPDIPEVLLKLWDEVGQYSAPPEACLVNYYREKAKLGLHIDADEQAPDAPVVSVSLGDDAIYRLGGPVRKGPTTTMTLASGDVVVLAGASRHYYHGVDRILAGSSRLLPMGGRINLTLRRVNPP